MTFEQLEKQLDAGIANVYLIIGPSDYLVRRYVKVIKDAALKGGFSDLNLSSFRAGRDDLASLPKIARTYPMMAKRRVIVLAESDRIPDEFTDVLGELAKEKIDTSCLIVHGEKFDKRSAFAKVAKDAGTLVEIDKLNNAQVASWAVQIAKEKGKKLSEEAVAFLSQQWGSDLQAMDQEIEKAALYAGAQSDRIDASDIRAVMVAPKVERIFDLTDAIGEKNPAKAIYFLDGMLEAGNKPLQVHGALYNHVKKLFRARGFCDSGMSRQDALQAIGGHPFSAGKAYDQARRLSIGGLKNAMLTLSKTDFDLKNSRVDHRIILEKMILDLCGSS
jgi:DNA polymerase III subunit delta